MLELQSRAERFQFATSGNIHVDITNVFFKYDGKDDVYSDFIYQAMRDANEVNPARNI